MAALTGMLLAVPVLQGPDEPELPEIRASELSVVVPEIPSDVADLPQSLLDPPTTETAAPETSAAAPSAADPEPRSAAAGGGGGGGGGLGSAELFGGPSSPWVQRLAANAPLDPNSAEYVRGLNAETFKMAMEEWSIPIYYADASTPRHDVPLTVDWAPVGTLRDVPLPSEARADPMDDAHLTIVDRSTDCVYEFWGAAGSGGGMSARWGNAIPADSDGIYDAGLATRASGFSAAAGLVTAEELRRGSIEHALVFAYPDTRSGGPVAPATESDGRTDSSSALPQGARVRLDPSIDLTTFGLNPAELTIARAIQRYGMILGDTSGAFTIYAEHPQSLGGGAYSGLLPQQTSLDMSNIPTQHLQVLDLPAQSDRDSRPVGNRCNGY
ncbi:hypothetical protein [Pseudonocardia sp.]|uniref:hypothetical protein n=1 Tax=Pseudonocardia sp. TaxID=60912 RepID=UPI002609C9EA|nr:hypothetical protein [Pseudonocardia sp.]